MKLEPAKIWKPTDDVWDLCAMRQDMGEQARLPGYIFTPELLCAKTGELAMRGIAPNTVLARALPEILNGVVPRSYNWMGLGTINDDPDRTQPGLLGQVSVANGLNPGGPRTGGAVMIDPYSWTFEGYWQSAYANFDLKEVGMTGHQLGYLNRAVFYEMDGTTKLTIVKTSGFVLRITGQINFTFLRY